MMSPFLFFLLAADAADDPVADAIAVELHRAKADLRLPGAPPPHYISALYFEGANLNQFATMGALVLDVVDTSPMVIAHLRTGSPEFDSSNFFEGWAGGWPEGSAFDSTVRGTEPDALRQDLWLMLDSCYKKDVVNLSRKAAVYADTDRTALPPSFLAAPPTVRMLPPALPPDQQAARDLVRLLSAHLGAAAGLEDSGVFLDGYGGRRLLIDTGGARVSTPEAQLEVIAVASIRRADGHLITDHHRWIVKDLAALPPRAALLAELDALVARLRAAQSATLATEAYSGPVLFEGEAAIDLFARLLGPALGGTPPSASVRGGETTLPPTTTALQTQLLPAGWRAWDDPRQRPDLPSSYGVDMEGVPATRLALIDAGVVVGLYDSRTPYKGQTVSHGYARGSLSELPRGAPGQLVVDPPRTRSARRVEQAGVQAAAQAGGPLLVVRRFADPSLTPLHPWNLALASFDPFPPLAEAYLRHPDGREERVLGLTFAEPDVGALLQIVAAGPSVTGTRRIAVGGDLDLIGPPFGVISTFTVPSVLIGAMTLELAEADDPQPLALPSPPR